MEVKMKDIIFYILIYMIWNTEFHKLHPTFIPVILTLWIVINVYEVLASANKSDW
jgi:hypothetical protein